MKHRKEQGRSHQKYIHARIAEEEFATTIHTATSAASESVGENKSKKREVEKMEKTTVTITASDGTQEPHSGDAVIVFTINKEWAEDGPTISGKSIYVGENIPCTVISDVLTNGIADIFTKMMDGHLTVAGSNLFMLAEKLKKRCEEIRENATEEDFKDSLSYLVGKLLTL